jgi:hypothetical protein
MINRTAIVNLKQYQITLTTSYEARHGVCGHMFEMIEYFMHFRFHKNLNAAILIKLYICRPRHKISRKMDCGNIKIFTMVFVIFLYNKL